MVVSSAFWDYWYFSQQSWFKFVLHPVWHVTQWVLNKSDFNERMSRLFFPHVLNCLRQALHSLFSLTLWFLPQIILFCLINNIVILGFPGSSDGKENACNAEDLDLIPELGRSPGRGHSNPLQYSCLENPHGQRSLVDDSGVAKKSDMTEWLSIRLVMVNWKK